MKINYSVTLEPSDVEQAINTYLAANGVNATVTADDLLEGMNDDLSILIQTQGEAAPANKPVKRRRKPAASKAEDVAVDESKLKPKQVPDEKSKGGLGTRDQTILEEANEENQARLEKEKSDEITEKVKAVDIDDVDETNSPVDDTVDDAVEDEPAVKNTAEEIVTNAKNSSVPLAKQGIFKKRAKKV
jgi:hypothetical protein